MFRFLPRLEWPAWLESRLKGRKCVEVKESGGNYYLYEYVNQWDKKSKRVKKTTRYAGVLKEFETGRVLEYGHVRLLLEFSNDFLADVQRLFPNEWKLLVAFAFNRVTSPQPLKRIGSWFEKTTLGRLIGLERVSRKSLAAALRRVGENNAAQNAFLEHLIKDGELLLYDGSLVYSSSRYNRLLEYGYDKHSLLLPQANIALLFSKTRGLPVHFRLFWGSLHEVNVVKSLVSELEGRNVIFVADKGYYKNALFDELDDNGISFIIPLPRDDSRIDYSKKLEGVMQYHRRIIRFTRYKKGRYWLYSFEDQLLKYEETTNFYRLKLAGKRTSFLEEKAGKITLLSNVKMSCRKRPPQ